MPPPTITALAPNTAHTLTSTQLFLSPLSAIKELVENALDAHASSVYIEISANTLDSIIVRDNGHGVPPQDRRLFGEKHCTSKISSFDEVRGVKTLGFRGEALYCLRGVAGSVKCETRCEGEEVGRAWVLGTWDAGGIEGGGSTGSPISHPVGTTVRVIDYFKNLPVRRKEAIQNAAKSMAQIKHLLQCYAFVRPAVRFSLRVLKEKSSKVNWTYAPSKPNGGIQESVLKILGKRFAAECQHISVARDGLELEAFLPKKDADQGNISGHGSFVSVNGRPVTAKKGTFKELVSMLKEKVKNFGITEGARDMFLWLHLRCPSNSYDVNIEPAKDDILLDDETPVINLMEELLNSAYSVNNVEKMPVVKEQETSQETRREAQSHTAESMIDMREDRDIEFSSERAKSPSEDHYDRGEANVEKWLEAQPELPDSDVDDEETLNSVQLSNPWIIAKITKTIRANREPRLVNDHMQPGTPSREQQRLVLAESSPSELPTSAQPFRIPPFPTPHSSSTKQAESPPATPRGLVPLKKIGVFPGSSPMTSSPSMDREEGASISCTNGPDISTHLGRVSNRPGPASSPLPSPSTNGRYNTRSTLSKPFVSPVIKRKDREEPYPTPPKQNTPRAGEKHKKYGNENMQKPLSGHGRVSKRMKKKDSNDDTEDVTAMKSAIAAEDDRPDRDIRSFMTPTQPILGSNIHPGSVVPQSLNVTQRSLESAWSQELPPSNQVHNSHIPMQPAAFLRGSLSGALQNEIPGLLAQTRSDRAINRSDYEDKTTPGNQNFMMRGSWDMSAPFPNVSLPAEGYAIKGRRTRTKSATAHLPLERTPPGYQVQSFRLILRSSTHSILSSMQSLKRAAYLDCSEHQESNEIWRLSVCRVTKWSAQLVRLLHSKPIVEGELLEQKMEETTREALLRKCAQSVPVV